MNSRILAPGLAFALALAGCSTVAVKGHYDFAEHPGMGLVALSTRMDAGNTCPQDIVTGTLGFRKGVKPSERVDAAILLPREPQPDAVLFTMQTPRPERREAVYGESTFSDMGGAQEVTIPAEPPTRFVVQEVPAGHYILNSLTVVIHGSSGRYKAPDPRPLSFTVKEGEVVYLGEMGIKLTRTHCALWEDGFSRIFEWSVRDEWGRDAAQFKAEIPNIRPEVVQKRLLEVRYGDHDL